MGAPYLESAVQEGLCQLVFAEQDTLPGQTARGSVCLLDAYRKGSKCEQGYSEEGPFAGTHS